MRDKVISLKFGKGNEMTKGTRVGETTDLETGQISFDIRAADIALLEKQMLEAAERAKKNDDFFMVFRGKEKGAEMMIRLTQENHNAAALFLYLSKEMDRTNALVASNKALAEVMKVSEPTMSRAIKHLVEQGYVAKFKSGGSSVFVANPDYVWNSWATGKSTCLFNNSKVLLSKSEQDLTVTKRFNVVMRKHENQELESTPKRRGRPKKITDENQLREELEAKGQLRIDVEPS